MASSTGVCCRTLMLARLASHGQACCLSPFAIGLTASAARETEQVRGLAGFVKPGGDAAIQKKSGPRDGTGEGNPRLQALVELLSSPTRKEAPPLSKKEQDALAAHQRLVAAEARAWAEDLEVKFHLQKAALKALPPKLRELAMQPDHTPFPMNRNCLFDTPPEAYRDPTPGSDTAVKAEKGRSLRG
ncbi:hypothetical protein PLESTF_001247200 [Pleodorina starrii]|nr:hypothetical protein PLESTF_001247200 [Pleodorina starrii]